MPRPKSTPRTWIRWYLSNDKDVAATCERFGISRATLYRWLKAYRENPNKPLTRLSTKPKTHRPPGYTVGQLLAVALIQSRHPDWGRKRAHRVLFFWHQYSHGEPDSIHFETHNLTFLTSLSVPSEATVGRMLNVIRRRCPFCEGPKNRYSADHLLVDSRFRRADGHTSSGCTWALTGLPNEIFEQRLPLAKLREVVREAKANYSVSGGKRAARNKRKQKAAANAATVKSQVNRVFKELGMKELMREIKNEER